MQLGSNSGRHSVDGCIVSGGAAGHAARLLHAEPELNALQPASVPTLGPLRAGFWWRGGRMSVCACKLLTTMREFRVVSGDPKKSVHPVVNCTCCMRPSGT